MKNNAFRLGCDIGGTFTDFVLVNDQTGEFQTYKCLTTPSDPSTAVAELSYYLKIALKAHF